MQIRMLLTFALLFPLSAIAGHVKGKSPNGYTTMVVSGGQADTATTKSFNVETESAKSRLYLVKDGELEAPVVVGVKYKGQFYSFDEAKADKICKKSGARLLMGLKSGGTLNVGTVKVKVADGVGYLKELPPLSKLDKSSTALINNKNKCLPEGTGATLGLATVGGSKLLIAQGKKVKINAESEDQDSDGLIDPLDIDKDNDGVLNAYDTEAIESSATTFNVFSNIKPNIENSLNQYVQSLTQSDLDNLVQNVTLAMQVAGAESDTVELNCNGLTYCSSGGTGVNNSIAFPDAADGDSDGFGTITRGGTGDFQLQTGASSTSAIGAGDAYIQIVNEGTESETKIPGMLNFVFNTTPAIASVTMGGVTTSVTYPATTGTSSSPFVSPSSWDGLLTVTAYRPQRPGISGAGEGAFVDVGNSTVVIDIPNEPCALGMAGCPGAGPGACAAVHYSESDANLESDPNGLKDSRADQDTDTANPSANTVTFTIDVINCLADDAITWNVGDKVAIDLQFKNGSGDNAAQKFYIQRQ